MTKHTVAQVEDMIATEDDAEVSAMLREYATLLAEKAEAETSIRQQQIPPAYATLLAGKEDTGTTHYVNCFGSGPKHYVCALMEITDLRERLKAETQLLLDGNKIASKCHREEVATLREQLGKAQSEYICTCGIRVTPHKCPTDNGF